MADRPWIVGQLGTTAFERLASGLSGSELQSVLLEVMHRRAARRVPRDLVAQYGRDAFCAPAAVDQRTAIELDAHLLAAAAEFEAIELSPVAPLGVCSAVALTDQKRTISALRGTEVVSDPTNVLALDCAVRLRARPGCPVHLATCQRVVRAQAFPKGRGFTQHFRLFALASGGPEEREHRFTVDTVLRHIRTALAGLDRLEAHGYAFGARSVEILATPEREALGARIAEQLGALATRTVLAHPYYSGGLRFQIWVTERDGASVPLIDGGVFDWLVKLTSNRRAVYVATGAGAQLMALRFRKPAAPRGQLTPRQLAGVQDGSDTTNTTEVSVRLEPVTRECASTLRNLYELYVYDFSEHIPLRVKGSGRFELTLDEAWWTRADHFAYFIKCREQLAGFALLRAGSRVTNEPEVMDVAEFFVLRGERGKGIGTSAAHALFRAVPRVWEVRVRRTNVAAMQFWTRAVESWVRQPVSLRPLTIDGSDWDVLRFTTGSAP